MDNKTIWPFYVTIIITIIVAVVFMCIRPFNDGSGNPNVETFQQYATFVGGISGIALGILNTYLIFITYHAQKRQFVTAAQRYKNEKDRQTDFFKTERLKEGILSRISAHPKKDIVQLLPHNWILQQK